MKKLLLLLALGASLYAENMKFEITNGSSQIHIPYKINDNGQCDQMIERRAYVSCYSYANKIPLFVAYKLTKESVSPNLKRPSRFFYDNTIPSEYRSKDSHYKRTGLDRGHMMPNAAADYEKQAQMETFILSNVVPQNSHMNRGIWKNLEGYTRLLAKRHNEIYVITGAIPSKNNFLKKGNVNIPSHMYKIIYIPSENKYLTYLMENISGMNEKDALKYKVDMNLVEKMSGIDFFVN